MGTGHTMCIQAAPNFIINTLNERLKFTINTEHCYLKIKNRWQMTVPDKDLDSENVSLLYYEKHTIMRGCDSQSDGMPSCLTKQTQQEAIV